MVSAMNGERDLNFGAFDAELQLAKRLAEHRVFIGDSAPPMRKEKFRAAIIDGGQDCTIFGTTRAGKTETYAQAFERIYCEPLQGKAKRRAK